MPTVINQSDIPTLPHLYTTNKLLLTPHPSFPPSPALNAKIALIRTDITKLHLPNGAIVNAANEPLLPGGGVCGAIHAAAGPDLADECQRRGGCPTGHAKMTRAYRLPCKKVIHAVGPIYWRAKQNNEHSRLLASCYTEALKLCVQSEITAVAFCALSTGIYGYPSYEAAETAIEAVRKFLETEEGGKMELVVFCNFEKKDEVAYTDLISKYFPPPEQDEGEVETTKSTDGADDANPESKTDSAPSDETPSSVTKTDNPSETPAKEAPPKETPAEGTEPAEPDDTDDFVLIDKADADTDPKQ